MEIRWVKGSHKITFSLPFVWFVLGIRGSGKSSFLESLGCLHLNEGNVVLDLFSSRDGENLGWLRSPYAEDKKILLLKAENVDVDSSFECKSVKDVHLSDFENYDIIISSPPFYSSIDSEFTEIAQLTDKLWRRLHWRRLVYVIMREASSFIYSRLKVSENQAVALSQVVYLLREARHVGLSLGLDSVRFHSIDINVRDIADFLVFKSQGMNGLPRDLWWLYSLFKPAALQIMPQKNFVILSRTGAVGVGEFSCPEWHKREKEDLLRKLGIKIEYGELPKEGEYRGKFSTIGDREHVTIMELYLEEELSMVKIAERLERSSGSIYSQIKKHNRSIERSGFCPSCRRMGSEYEKTLAVRGVSIKQEKEHLS